MNAALISGLSFPAGIAISGDKLFVTNFETGTIGEYTTSGATVNPALITGLIRPIGIAVSGDKLFVVNNGNFFEDIPGTIGEYTTSGVTVNAALISSGLNDPSAIDVASPSVPDGSSTWMLLLLGLAAMFGLKPLLRRPARHRSFSIPIDWTRAGWMIGDQVSGK